MHERCTGVPFTSQPHDGRLGDRQRKQQVHAWRDINPALACMEGPAQMNVIPVEVSSSAIRKTLSLLRRAGLRETVLLWLGREAAEVQRIVDVYRPIQHGAVDYFEIARKGMAALMDRLRTQGLHVVSQVHTHPKEAFHSFADDKWAIVRHVGALSIDGPYLV